MTRKRDLAFEALSRVTHANEAIERGKLNRALAAIRVAWHEEGGLEEDLPTEIERRARAYQEMWPGITLSPIPLASHWKRVVAQAKPKTPQQKALEDLRRESDG
jgi:hypothetical protein